MTKGSPTAPNPHVKLMLEFQSGKQEAFHHLFVENKEKVFHFLFRYFNDADLADEWTQETFLRVYQARATYKPLAAFSTWLFTIAAHLALNALRDQRRWSSLDAAPVEGQPVFEPEDRKSPTPDIIQTSLELSVAVARALQELPESQRVLVLLTAYDDLPIVEAAKILGITAVGARLRLLRARAQLRRKLARFEGPETF